jgi:precorrin-2 dehydrogenase/sirohydrochlorin ferrochelatase
MPTYDQAPFYPVSLNLVGRRCVVVGAANDREAVEKEAALRESGAAVVRIDPAALRDEDVIDAFFVISTPQDAQLSGRLRALADEHRFLLCCIDQPAFGFVAMTAIAKAGPVRVAISTTGLAPRVGKKMKQKLQEAMDATFARFVDRLARAKTKMKEEYPGPDHAAKRRQAMIDAAEGFDVEIRFKYPHWFEDESGG